MHCNNHKFTSKNRGFYWVAYIENGNTVQYFNSFGNLKPPQGVVKHFGDDVKVIYNYTLSIDFSKPIKLHPTYSYGLALLSF